MSATGEIVAVRPKGCHNLLLRNSPLRLPLVPCNLRTVAKQAGSQCQSVARAACLTTKLIALHAHATGHSCHSLCLRLPPCLPAPRSGCTLQQVAGQDACVPYQVSVSTCCNLRRTVAPTICKNQNQLQLCVSHAATLDLSRSLHK